MSTSLRQRLADYFKARPGVWIDGRELATVAGSYAWRTRASECRTVLGMHIENKVETIHRQDGSKYVQSSYRYVPADLLELAS